MVKFEEGNNEISTELNKVSDVKNAKRISIIPSGIECERSASFNNIQLSYNNKINDDKLKGEIITRSKM